MPQSSFAGTLKQLDHLVLTVADIETTVAFYRDVLRMEPMQFQVADGSQRWALRFGDMKINLHKAGREFDPKAKRPLPGSADLCFLTQATLEAWLAHLDMCDVAVEEGPVPRSGATGPITSIYLRDPNGNLIEIAVSR
ncbi:VOC family protein [Sulfitobacter sp. S190]|uniref:VOC family protein n=1 Tax=Sulfitobacter sp. S190 TaxID=2867022 RepID=UPI0021A7EE31|nr:VOC family protein [Sulfitobacter sp. S190]UWR22752.1 VOC family protein [Sulfitobacter sp. S190]